MMQKNIKKWAKPEPAADDSPKSSNGMCMAYGCPMVGAVSSSTSGQCDSWMCAAHFRAEPFQWASVTSNYRKNMDLVTLVQEIRLAQNGKPFDVKGRIAGLKNVGSDDYLPCDLDRRLDGTLSMRLWQTRLEKILYSKVTSGLEQVSVDAQSKNQDQIMSAIDEFMKKHVNGQ